MAAEIKTKKAKKRTHVLVDVKVHADLSSLIYRSFYKDVESEAKALERAVKDFHGFLRDHRSQDLIVLEVQRKYKNLCSVCGEEWEPYKDEDDGKDYCAGCGAIIEENA